MPGFNMRPPAVELAADLSLAATYGNVGSAPVSIAGGRDITLKLGENANAEDAVVRAYVSNANTAPTAVASMFQVVGVAGAETEITITQNTSQIFQLPITGKWLWLNAKGAVGTGADLDASMFINYGYDDHLQKFTSATKPFSAAAVVVGASATQIGSVLDIRGLGDLTLYVTESGGVNGVISVFFLNSDAEPLFANMVQLKSVVPAAVTFTTVANEKAAHYIGNVCADYMAISATGQNSALLVDVFGSLNGFHG